MTGKSEQTIGQIDRFIRKVSEKYPESDENISFTDIHIRASQDTGDLMAFDDNDNEITRCVIEEWIDNKSENFFSEVSSLLRKRLHSSSDIVGNLGILKPYNFVLEDDERESQAELFVADDETIIIGGDLMEGLDTDLDEFLKHLSEE